MQDDNDHQQSPRKHRLEPSDEKSGRPNKKKMESSDNREEEEGGASQSSTSTSTVGGEPVDEVMGIIGRIKDPAIQEIFIALAKIEDDQKKMARLESLADELISPYVKKKEATGASAPGENESFPATAHAENNVSDAATWAQLCDFAEQLESENCNNAEKLSICPMKGAIQIQDQAYTRGGESTKTVKELFEYVRTEKKGIQYIAHKDWMTVTFPYQEAPSLESFQGTVAPFYPDTAAEISSLLRALRDTYEDKEESDNKDENGSDRKYIADFVLTKPLNFGFRDAVVAGQVPLSKSKALLVAGVSGTGKSWLTRFGLPQLCPKSSFLFCTLPDNLGMAVDVPAWMSRAMSVLFGKAKELPDLYERISKSSMELNSSRNERANQLFHAMCLEKLNKARDNDKELLLKWWNGNGPTLGHLVVVLDECGKSLPFTRGIIDSCRDLAGELENAQLGRRTARAEKAKIVLAGTRLDTWSGTTFQNRTAHGTDPAKYEVVQMMKPDLSKLPPGISKEDLGGWYSKIFAENTRILMRALIPTLCQPALTDHYYQQGEKTPSVCRREDRVAAGSNNTLMKYGARLYYVLNAVSDLKDNKKRREFFSVLFGLFLTRSLKQIGRGKRADFFARQEKRLKTFHIETSEKNLSQIFARGLALEDPTSEPNRAMEYLACHGEHLPLNFGDGLALEAALEHHLKKFYYSKTKEDPDTFTLRAAWAPAAKTKKDPAKKKPAAAFITLSEDHDQDIRELAARIIKMLGAKEEGAVHVILSQGVINAEGPDKMVIIASKENGKVRLILDLYQCKNYTDFKEHCREQWFHTVGLYKDDGKMKVSAKATQPKEAYCESYVSELVEGVGKLIPECVESVVGLRAVVVPQSANEVVQACRNTNGALSAAGEVLSAVEESNENVLLWTRDCMRPTIRVIKVEKGKGN